METLLTQLRADYDVVLLDAPPLLPVTDAALLAVETDGALVVVRHGRTTKDQLSHALDRLDAVDAKPLGLVFNMVPARRAGGGSYSYTYSYDYASRPARGSDKGRAARNAPKADPTAPIAIRRTAEGG
jgi:receptor protein-tyrosine kinase